MTEVDFYKPFDTVNRPCPDVPEPSKDILERDVLFGKDGTINLPALQDHLVREGRLAIPDITEICNRAAAIFRTEPNVVEIGDEVRVAGDLHASYYDFVKLLEVGGDPATSQYLFLGDYVDRGFFGCELLIHMLALKVSYPKTWWMLRGNHESRQLVEHFNFKRECLYKYSIDVLNAFLSVFDTMPIGALIGERRFFCVHAGISPQLKKLDAVATVNRFRDVPESGLMADLLWSDPLPADAEGKDTIAFTDNTARNCSYFYGATAVRTFLRTNSLVALVRGHECKDQGFEMQFPRSGQNPFPTVITLFSCPNYVDSFKNQAALLIVKKEKIHFRQFTASPHPYFLPNFIDVFQFSLPYVAENLTSMLLEMLKYCSSDDNTASTGSLAERRGDILAKIQSVGRLSRMFQTLREENEAVVALKGFCDGQLQKGLLLGGRDAIQTALSSFQKAMDLDKENLKRPNAEGKKPDISDEHTVGSLRRRKK
ncbi:putative Serine/threonine-protein phosphatase 2B catalytic subunit [Blattamonas nauphoetae]|uniref:Serine/threonine-protein phosphatase n=1 Tax=Blattamonas nauphoetae TaxID=2049346 RepID=A0ABQ9YKR8_9EUKA|nr:putative Serine/threonine-protein phosphatase 2B catalytic subunit [Blattamonas nauphoetae]